VTQNSTDQQTALSTVHSDYGYQEELTLVDLYYILIKRKFFFIAVFLFVVLLIGAKTLLMKPVYESRAVIQVAQIGSESQFIEQPESLTRRLKENYRVNDESEGRRKLPYVESVSAGKGNNTDGGAITITSHANSAAEAHDFLSGIVQQLLQEHKTVFDKAIQERKKEFDELVRQIDSIQTQADVLSERIRMLTSQNPSLAGMLILEKTRIMAELPALLQRRGELEFALSSIKSKPTRVIRKPTLPVKQIKPRVGLYMLLSVLVGLMLGIFAVFFSEFISRVRQELKRRDAV